MLILHNYIATRYGSYVLLLRLHANLIALQEGNLQGKKECQKCVWLNCDNYVHYYLE